MEAKINIVGILKDKPQGTKLYSSACGKCKLEEVDDKSFKISFYNSKFGFMNGGEGYLDKNGKLYDDGECVVFPSKEMRDWSKFAWKKGDVLVSNDSDSHIIFKGFSKDDYTTFEGKHWISVSKKRHISRLDTQNTQNYHIEDNKEVAQTYIKTIEKKLGGKFNRETLEVEKPHPEFKDGDILSIQEDEEYYHTILIFKGGADVYVYFDCFHRVLTYGTKVDENEKSIYHLATEEEKQQLFTALAKEGKAWDAEKKVIVDLKSKWNPKPFDRVVTRVDDDAIWTANIFSHIDQYGEYNTIGCVGGYPYCLPYNEDTAKLIGTTDDWKGGKQ